MDAIASPARAILRANGFFLGMSVAIALTVVGGFGQFALRGMVDVARVPFWVHVHAAIFMLWTWLFVAQNVLVQRGTLALHRRLGWVTAGLAVAMVPLGGFTAAMSIVRDRLPPFFQPDIFIALNLLELAAFTLLMSWAIRARRRTEWHKRLMLCAMIAIIGPAFGRILPMPLLGPWAGLAVMGAQLLFVLPLIIHDLRRAGRIHPASLIGGATILIEGLAVPILAATPLVAALARALSPA
ncbi:MAG: hypothetical protein VX205_06510 [Pseudomonadota bacterium]|nr:hypothetical protein [Sphingobium naphthae]MEC8034630.1 hypothetical protein [Pseudomonadota bacterium]|tara:strand:- start:131 stop:853 length:723 start_codon:yes stop_codon:yes gene_type:complete